MLITKKNVRKSLDYFNTQDFCGGNCQTQNPKFEAWLTALASYSLKEFSCFANCEIAFAALFQVDRL